MSGIIPQQRRLTAYLNDPCAVCGAGPLLEQKRVICLAAEAMDGAVSRWCVDSGRRFPGQRCGDALLRLLGDVGEGDTVVVSDFSALGADPEAVAVVAGTFAMFGVAVLAARDVLDVSRSVVAAATIPVPGRADVGGRDRDGRTHGQRALAVAS